ncbi:MAG TPA: hypothetical protein VEJ63_22150 [Planctomycetota bacterium]|nr:hypothetical protein [Planctomycetota bacterium]
MRACLGASRALATGLAFAAIGFCVSLATSRTVEVSSSASSRAVGTSALRFTNPLVALTPSNPDEYDLGDACFGSTDPRLVTRYITAAGGLRPYRFTSEGPLSLDRVLAGTFHSLELGLSGALVGTMPFSLPPSTTTVDLRPGFRFQVTVRDSQGTGGTSKTGFFNLYLFNCTPGFFKFASDTLPSGLLGSPYSAKIDVLGGTAPYTYTVVSVAGGVTKLEDLGLFITNDGTIMGNPLVTGTFVITVRATDANNAVANNRANTAPNQAFTLTVSPNSVTSSDLVTLACSVRGDKVRTRGDTLRYVGAVNALGQDRFTLANSDFAFRLANIIVTGKLDGKGTFATTLADGSQVKASISPVSGLLSVTISRGTFATAINAAALVDGQPARRPVQVTIGDAVVTSETLDFETRVGSSRYSLNYALGRQGASAAGAFQIVKVKGADGTTSGGLPGDAWRVNFIAVAPSAIQPVGTFGLDNVTAVTIRIGQSFVQNLSPIKSGKTTRFSGKTADSVSRFSLPSKNGKGTLQTRTLATRSTGIPQAVNAPAFGNLFFPLGVDLTRTGAPFIGEHARRIFGLGTQYKDVPPKP